MELLDMYEAINETKKPIEEGFIIDNERKLNWVVSKMEAMQLRIREQDDIRKDKLKKLRDIQGELTLRIEADFKAATLGFLNELRGLVHQFGLQIMEFTQKEIEAKNSKSIKVTMNSQTGFRKELDKFEVNNQEELLAWAYAEDPELVEVKEFVSIEKVKEYYTSHGVIPEGVTIEKGNDKFFLKVAGIDVAKDMLPATANPESEIQEGAIHTDDTNQ